jgi:hypothetical protein
LISGDIQQPWQADCLKNTVCWWFFWRSWPIPYRIGILGIVAHIYIYGYRTLYGIGIYRNIHGDWLPLLNMSYLGPCCEIPTGYIGCADGDVASWKAVTKMDLGKLFLSTEQALPTVTPLVNYQ